MDEAFKIPPKSAKHLTEISKLLEILKGLIGSEFRLTGKTRTDGANVRKLIAKELLNNGLPEAAKYRGIRNCSSQEKRSSQDTKGID